MTPARSTPTADAAQKSSVIIVDDHPVVRHGLAQYINQENDLVVSGQAGDAHEALKLIEEISPDIVIADLSLRDRPGLELIKDIESQFPKLPVLVLSMHDESLWAERVLRAGARGYIMKQEATDKVVNAIRRVLNGDIWVSEAIAARMLQKLSKGRPAAEGSPLEALTDRELVIFQMVGLGLSVREIAARLSLSAKTVEAHREHIKEKLNLKSSAELLRYAILCTLDDS
jgi:DNA-binding NarL/FixJ family response regulator